MTTEEKREPMMSDAQVNKLVDIFLTALTGGDNAADLEAAVNALSSEEFMVLDRTVLDLDATSRRLYGDVTVVSS